MSKGKFRRITLAEQVQLALWTKELGAPPSISAICRRFSCGDVFARRLLSGEDATPPPAQEKAWEEHEDSAIARLRSAGLSTAQVAARLPGRSEQAVRSRIGRLRDRGVKIGYVSGPRAGLLASGGGRDEGAGSTEDRAARSSAERGSCELLAALLRLDANSAGSTPEKSAAPPRALTFEEQLERVRNGARLAPVITIRPAIADITFGGVGSSML